MEWANTLTNKYSTTFLLSLLAVTPAASATSQTCAAYGWGTWPTEPPPPLNTPSAAHATDVNSKAQASEAAKVASMLTCQPTLLSTLPAVSTPSDPAFHTRVRSAANTDKKMLAKAIYEKFLINKGEKFSGMNIQTRAWDQRQATNWCLQNGGDDDTPLPNDLLTLEQGIEHLDMTAIALAWQRTQKLSSQRLGRNCNDVLKEFKATGIFLK